MTIGLPKERQKNEHRVALVPETVKKFVSEGFRVNVEKGSGEAAFYSDSEYKSAGAIIVPDFRKLAHLSDIIVKIRPPEKLSGKTEVSFLKPSSAIFCLQEPLSNSKNLVEYNRKKISSFALEFIPRSTLAQSMDVLTSMASLAGYKAVLMAADMISKIMPMMMTAAGTISASKVLVIGAGVAGLQAIATARRLGAVVEAFDTRPQVKEEVMSLGGKFIDMNLTPDMQDDQGYARLASPEFIKMEMELIEKHLSRSDICITTAQIFGRKAPILIKDYMIKHMRPGSVIIDLAAESGGNCNLTRPGKTVTFNGVRIVGVENITSELSSIASKLFSKNMENLLLYLVKDKKINYENPDDDILNRLLLTYNGETVSNIYKQLKGKK